MIRARIRIALVGVLILCSFPLACHRTPSVRRDAEVGPVVRDTVAAAAFEDTVLATVPAEAGVIALRTPAQRDSLLALLRKERALWRATSPRDYQYLLRVGCFCPGSRGWLLIEVRNGQSFRAWDAAGKPAALTDWNTLSIDGLFDNLERAVDANRSIRLAFDPRWHFPSYISTVTLPGPDTWSIIEARGFQPIPS